MEVGIYNALWFARPVRRACARDPAARACGRYLERGHALGRRHEQVLVVVTLTALGAYLTVKGLVRLF